MLLISGGIQKTGIFWYYTFPLLAFFLKGRRIGFYYLGFLMLISLFAFLLHKINLVPTFPYSYIELRQLLLSLLAVTLLVYFYEKVRVESDIKIKEHEKEILIKNIFDLQFQQAGEIQRNFIPRKNIILPEIEIVGFYQPVLEIGGDYMDFFYLDADRIAVLVADVSGKGIPAALIMIKLRTLVRSQEFLVKMSASETISFLNRFFRNDPNSDMFITMIYLIINLKTGVIDFSNAGQGPLTYFSKNKKNISTLDCYGMPLGISESHDKFESCHVKLFPGDIITLFTDGISEASNNKGEKYTKEMLYARIQATMDLPGEIISKKIMDEVLQIIEPGKQKDDITLVVIKKK
jgi:sigma-B regulation protein RsbU (phosphoserine phosphatase)